MQTENTPRKRVKDHEVFLTKSAATKAQKIAEKVTKGDPSRLVTKLINQAYRNLGEVDTSAGSAQAFQTLLAGGDTVAAPKPAGKSAARNGTTRGAKGRTAKAAGVGVKKTRRTTRRRSK